VLPLPEAANTLVIGRIELIHIRPDIIDSGGRIDLKKLAPVGRLVGDLYCRTSATFTLDYNTFEHLASKQASD
jgi:flavin reductase (DIM6/NTAB) family NADH-FMN oxidoreductase RutF